MGSRYGAEVGSPFDQRFHLLPGFLVSLLPFGILQSVAHSGLVDVGDVGTENLILPAQLIHLVFELSTALLQAVEQRLNSSLYAG